MSAETISPRRLFELRNADVDVELIDVRTPAEYREMHVSFARNVPLDRLSAATLTTDRTGSPQPLYVICRSGGRGKRACEMLIASGRENVINVEGGTLAWEQAGLPVVRGEKAISLERQVRIAAGSLVLIGSALGALIHPYWFGLAAFVGAGLVFAGVTDTCGMGLILARMPWNQGSASSDESSPAAACSTSQANS